MTDGIEQRVGDLKPKDRRVVPFSEFTKDDIVPGVVICFSSANQLNEFMMQIGKATQFVFSREHGNIVNNAQSSKASVSEMLRTQEMQKKYFGPLRNFRIMVFPPDIKSINKPEDVLPDTVSTFLAEADIYSSGVGKAAEVHLLCSFYIRNKKDPHNSNRKSPHLSFSGKPIQNAPLIPDNSDINPMSRKILTLVVINKKQDL